MAKKRPRKPEPAPHRRRLQAQGPNVEKAVPWNRESPPSKREMLAMLDQLWAKLTQNERQERQPCYVDAQAYINNAPANGIAAPIAKTFRNRKLRGGVRIDLEIHAGTACNDDAK